MISYLKSKAYRRKIIFKVLYALTVGVTTIGFQYFIAYNIGTPEITIYDLYYLIALVIVFVVIEIFSIKKGAINEYIK